MTPILTSDFGQYHVLLCPACGFEYTHVDEVEVGTASGVGARIVAGGEDEYSIAIPSKETIRDEGRRHTITLAGSCENGHEFQFAFMQHKGQTHVTCVVPPIPLIELCESPPERDFWEATHRNREWLQMPVDFRPQVKHRRYRLDFGSESTRFGVEIDGLAYHNGQDSFVRDRKRQRELESDGWRIVRFAAKEVTSDPDAAAREMSQAFLSASA